MLGLGESDGTRRDCFILGCYKILSNFEGY